ncbi:MAG: thiamine diphosphokinase [Acidimicrobiales bacterium]
MGHAAGTTGPIILIAIGGAPGLAAPLPTVLPEGSVVVAADSGVAHAQQAGLHVDHLVGDLDSASPDAVARAEAAGTVVHRHHPDKDATDTELALDLAAHEVAPRTGIRELVVVGPGGGRLDHLVADVLGLASPGLEGFDVTARLGAATITIVRAGHGRDVHGEVGEQVSLLPVHGPAIGVTTVGLRWALEHADLRPGTTRGISNELVRARAHVVVRNGTLAVLQPGAPAPELAPRPTPYDPSPRIPEGGPT